MARLWLCPTVAGVRPTFERRKHGSHWLGTRDRKRICLLSHLPRKTFRLWLSVRGQRWSGTVACLTREGGGKSIPAPSGSAPRLGSEKYISLVGGRGACFIGRSVGVTPRPDCCQRALQSGQKVVGWCWWAMFGLKPGDGGSLFVV